MAQRQESSVRVSIEELLREAHASEERDRREAAERTRAAEQRRVDEQRRRLEVEQARLRAEDAERARRVFDEEKRKVELRALQEGAVVRARTEVEMRARLAEIAARQEHEQRLHALRHDRHKKQLARVLVGLVAFAVAGGIGAGVVIKRSKDDAVAAGARLRAILEEKAQLEQEQAALQQAIGAASNPQDMARLQQQLADAQQQLQSLTARSAARGMGSAAIHPSPPSPGAAASPVRSPGPAKTTDTCLKGDPLCATIP
jgi:hypothetical protein